MGRAITRHPTWVEINMFQTVLFCQLLFTVQANNCWQSGALPKLKSYTGSQKVAQIVPKNIIGQISFAQPHYVIDAPLFKSWSGFRLTHPLSSLRYEALLKAL